MKLLNKIENLLSKKYILYLIIIIFWLYTVGYEYYYLVIKHDSWILGDWLINYQDGGFKRRGFMGTVFLKIYDIFRIPLDIQVFLFLSMLYTFFYIQLYQLIRNKKNVISILFLFLVPIGLQMPLIDPSILGRKEIFLITLFLWFLNHSLHKKYRMFVLFLIIVVSLLVHEVVLFYLPYFFYVTFVLENNKWNPKYLLIFLLPIILGFYMFLFGKIINHGETYTLLENRGLFIEKDGILDYDVNFDILGYYKSNIFNYLLYSISYLFSIIFITIYLLNHDFPKKNRLILFYVLSFLYSIPLFYLATDWGRWIFIHFVLMTFILVKYADKENKSYNKLMIFILPTHFLWGMSITYLGFHFYTKFNLIMTKIFYYLNA